MNLMDTCDGQEPTTLDLRLRIRDETMDHTHVDTAVLQRLVMKGQTRIASTMKLM